MLGSCNDCKQKADTINNNYKHLKTNYALNLSIKSAEKFSCLNHLKSNSATVMLLCINRIVLLLLKVIVFTTGCYLIH